MTYYREATVHTQELLDLLVKCENKIQTVSGAAPIFTNRTRHSCVCFTTWGGDCAGCCPWW